MSVTISQSHPTLPSGLTLSQIQLNSGLNEFWRLNLAISWPPSQFPPCVLLTLPITSCLPSFCGLGVFVLRKGYTWESGLWRSSKIFPRQQRTSIDFWSRCRRRRVSPVVKLRLMQKVRMASSAASIMFGKFSILPKKAFWRVKYLGKIFRNYFLILVCRPEKQVKKQRCEIWSPTKIGNSMLSLEISTYLVWVSAKHLSGSNYIIICM